MNDFRIDYVLEKISRSQFRNKFHLKSKDLEYIRQRGINTIKEHAKDFVSKRLSPSTIFNDGKQTPMKGHPVFVAQHATATCCRTCLYKWHHIPRNITLTTSQQEYVVNVIISWIMKEIEKSNCC